MDPPEKNPQVPVSYPVVGSGQQPYPNAGAQPAPSVAGFVPGQTPYQPQVQQPYPMQQQPMPAGYTAQPPAGMGYQQQAAYPTAVAVGGPAAIQMRGVQPGQQVVVVQQSYVGFGRVPANVVCPNCHAQVLTTVTTSPGATSWLCCIGLFVIGLWPCSCLPFCMDSCQDVTHSCPNCGLVLRRKNAFED